MINPSIEIVSIPNVDVILDTAWNKVRGSNTSTEVLLKSPLQYRNLPYYVLKVTSSMYFRDFLAATNEINIFAETKRKVFSKDKFCDLNILPDYQVVSDSPEDESKLSAYYTDYKDQLSKGSKEINRRLLPMGVATTYCISANLNQLYEVITYINLKAPRFSQYALLLKEVLPAGNGFLTSLTENIQRIDKAPNKLQHLGDYCELTITTDRSIMAQFMRHKGIKVVGYDLPSSNESYLYGDEVTYKVYTSYDNLLRIVHTRMCAFSQTVGTGVNSWWKVISTVIPNLDAYYLINHLPCKGCCKSCKFKDDMKDRDCPILNRTDGEDFAKKWNNSIGDAYKQLRGIINCDLC